MKLRNTSRFSDTLVHWAIGIARECLIGDPLSMAGVRVWVRKLSRGGTSGHAWPHGRRIVASVGPDSKFPVTYTYKKAVAGQHLADSVEGLCSILAHELQHLVQVGYTDEVQCEWVAHTAVQRCRERRAEANQIMADDRELAAAEPKVNPLEAMAAGRAAAADRRLAGLRARVERWEAKLQRAQAALKKLRPKLRASEKRAAARSGS